MSAATASGESTRTANRGGALLDALRTLAPVTLGRRGGLLFGVATLGWLGQSLTEWSGAALLLVYLHSLGLLGSDSLPAWLPEPFLGRGALVTWTALLVLAGLQSLLQITSYQARQLISLRVQARLRMLLAARVVLGVGIPPPLSHQSYLSSEIFPRTAAFFYHCAQVACVGLQALALAAAMLYVAPVGALVALLGLGCFGLLVLAFNRLNNRAARHLPPAQHAYERSKVRFSRNWLFIRALRLEREEYLAQLDASARSYRFESIAFFFGNLGSALGPLFGILLLAVIVGVHATLLQSPAAELVAFLYLLFRFQQILANGSNLLGGLITFRTHAIEAAHFVREFDERELEEALRVDPGFHAFRAPTIEHWLDPEGQTHATRTPPAGPPALSICDLRFQWPGSERPLFSGLNAELRAGGLLGISGANGTGKSTLLALLIGSLRPSAGGLRLDGRDCTQWISAHREWVGFVGPDAYLVSGTLRENLAYGLDRVVEDVEAWRALERVGVAARVRSLPRSLDHPIAEGGEGLSAGEKQKVALARALLRQPRLLLLDEPTAHVDELSERDIRSTLDRLRGECTIVLVSHKPALLEGADAVLHFETRPDEAPSGPEPDRTSDRDTEVPVLRTETLP